MSESGHALRGEGEAHAEGFQSISSVTTPALTRHPRKLVLDWLSAILRWERPD